MLFDKVMRRAAEEGFYPKALDYILYSDEAEPLLANGSVAILPKANALRLSHNRFVAKPIQEEALCLDEWIAARADDSSRVVSEFVRAYGTRSKAVLQPSQLSLAMGGETSAYSQCSSN